MNDLVCAASGERFPWSVHAWRHAGCHAGCDDPPRFADGPGVHPADIDHSVTTPWRYGAALRVEAGQTPGLGVGFTPLVEHRWADRQITVKCEHLNPTGSFKDRGAVVLLAQMAAAGVDHIIEDSSGNAGAAIATYAAALGIGCTILAPSSAPPAKLRQIRRTGATVDLVDGSRDDVTAEAVRRAEAGAVWASHVRQPAFNEGMRTLAFEIWEQSGYSAPDHVVVPVGNGASLLGLYLGFTELAACGSIDAPPRLHAGQADRRAALCGMTPSTEPTVADGIAVSVPVRLNEMTHAVRATDGRTLAIREDVIIDTWNRLNRTGLALEPTCAVAFAATEQLISSGEIAPRDSVVVVATGTGLKSDL